MFAVRAWHRCKIDDWELSFVTEKEVVDPTDTANAEERPENQIDLPSHELASGEILLILNRDPYDTHLANGVNVETNAWKRLKTGLQHKYIVRPEMRLPDEGFDPPQKQE